MSNVATVQSIYEAFGRGDIPAILDRISDDVIWEAGDPGNSAQEAGVPWMLPRREREGVAEFFQQVSASLEFHGFEPLNLLEGGNQVAATIRSTSPRRPPASGSRTRRSTSGRSARTARSAGYVTTSTPPSTSGPRMDHCP